MTKPLPPAVILAGGQARRMGARDKALVQLAGRPLLTHVTARLAPQVSALAINANGDPARFEVDLPVLPDATPDWPGPLAGVEAGMIWARAAGHDWIVTAPVDSPFLPLDLVSRLVARQAATGAPIVLAASADGLQPVFGLWSTAVLDRLSEALAQGMRKVAAFAETQGATREVFEPEAFFNINTPEDLHEAEARLAP